jgi:hypothetical protein
LLGRNRTTKMKFLANYRTAQTISNFFQEVIFNLISLGLIPRSFASIFLATDSQIKKEHGKSVNLWLLFR